MADAILTRDKAGVLKIWEMHEKPIFSIWENKRDPAFHNADERESERERVLHECLDFIQESQTTSIFIIKFHDEPNKNGKITSATPVIGSLSFRLNEPNTMRNGNTAVVTAGAAGMDMMKELFESRLQMIDLKFQHELEKKDQEIERLQLEAAAAEEEDEYEDDEDSEELGIIGQIGEAGNKYPWMQNALAKVADAFADLVVVAKHKMKVPAAAINGVNNSTPQEQQQQQPGAKQSDDQRIKAAYIKMIHYFVSYHGFPPGSTDESIQAMDPEEQEAYKLKGFKEYADTMQKLAALTDNPQMMELALRTLKSM